MKVPRRKLPKDTGKRTVSLTREGEVLTARITEPDGPGDLYDLVYYPEGGSWLCTKITADGERVKDSDVYEVVCDVHGDRMGDSCTCPGWRHGWYCRHVGLVTALLRAGKLSQPALALENAPAA